VQEILNQKTESKEFAQVTAQIEFFLRSGLGDYNAAQSALNIKKNNNNCSALGLGAL